MDRPNPKADPVHNRPIELQLAPVATSGQAAAAAGSPSAELDRYGIAVVLKASYEWSGYRYTNAADAIAAAKRAGR
jgi:hypothetical protein